MLATNACLCEFCFELSPTLTWANDKTRQKNGEQYASLVNKSRNERNEQYEKENNHHEYTKSSFSLN